MSADIPWRARARILLGAIKREVKFGCLDFAAWTLCRGRIGGGLFRGLAYPQFGWRLSISPKVLGTYEAELISVLDWAMRAGFDRIVNVGSAEGYYAIGLARVSPAVRVDAFEIDPRRRARLVRNAKGNGVGAQITPHGLAEAATLRPVLEGTREPLLLVDIEGAERELLDPVTMPVLRQAWLLVESHPSVRPDVEEVLRARFAASHRIFRFDARDWPARRAEGERLVRFHWLARFAWFCDERRAFPTPWLFMAPRSAARALDPRVVLAGREL